MDRKGGIRLLLLNDLNGQMILLNHLCETLVSSEAKMIDVVVVLGGFVAEKKLKKRASIHGQKDFYGTLEQISAAEGDMMALISRLEMIVCKVVYITAQKDPPTTRTKDRNPPILTQYSTNCFTMETKIAQGLYVMSKEYYNDLVTSDRIAEKMHKTLLVLNNSPASSSPCKLINGVVRVDIVAGPRGQADQESIEDIVVGSFRHGCYTILDLERNSPINEEKEEEMDHGLEEIDASAIGEGHWRVRNVEHRQIIEKKY